MPTPLSLEFTPIDNGVAFKCKCTTRLTATTASSLPNIARHLEVSCVFLLFWCVFPLLFIYLFIFTLQACLIGPTTTPPRILPSPLQPIAVNITLPSATASSLQTSCSPLTAPSLSSSPSPLTSLLGRQSLLSDEELPTPLSQTQTLDADASFATAACTSVCPALAEQSSSVDFSASSGAASSLTDPINAASVGSQV